MLQIITDGLPGGEAAALLLRPLRLFWETWQPPQSCCEVFLSSWGLGLAVLGTPVP